MMSVDMKDYLAYQQGYEAGKRDAADAIEELEATIELMKLNMPDFFPDANKVTLPKMEVQDGQK